MQHYYIPHKKDEFISVKVRAVRNDNYSEPLSNRFFNFFVRLKPDATLHDLRIELNNSAAFASEVSKLFNHKVLFQIKPEMVYDFKLETEETHKEPLHDGDSVGVIIVFAGIISEKRILQYNALRHPAMPTHHTPQSDAAVRRASAFSKHRRAGTNPPVGASPYVSEISELDSITADIAKMGFESGGRKTRKSLHSKRSKTPGRQKSTRRKLKRSRTPILKRKNARSRSNRRRSSSRQRS